MYLVNGKLFWDNGKVMENVLICSPTRFEFFVQGADTSERFEALEIVPSDTLPHSEVIYVDEKGRISHMRFEESE